MKVHGICIAFLVSLVMLVFLPRAEVAAQHVHGNEENIAADRGDIGEVDFRVACEEAVREDFDHALGMMHHMMYVASREVFEEVIEADPDCAMAYWGVATAYIHPLWDAMPSEEVMQRSTQYLNQARELAETERERLLIESTAAFFEQPEDTGWRERLLSWSDAMEDAYNEFPDDLDIAALYGLARVSDAQYVEDRAAVLDEAEEVLREVFEQEPQHPGAIHYSIHATDVDGRAENALDMVEVYAEIAPEVAHALHMPSHIYVRLGDWPQVIEWNKKSAEAALEHPVDEDVESLHYIHAVDYVVYGYLQRGENEQAEAAFEEVMQREKHQPTFATAFHFAAIPARLAVEQRDWDRAANLEPQVPDDQPWDAYPWAESLTWYARGLGSVHTGDLNAAREAERKMTELRETAEELDQDRMATYIEIDRLVLAGRLALEEGNHEEAIELTQSAGELEQTVEKHPVTPGALQPPFEALGDLHMDLDQHEEALRAYEASDEIWPGRLNTLMGAAMAARMIGEEQTARNHFEKLLKSATGEEAEAD